MIGLTRATSRAFIEILDSFLSDWSSFDTLIRALDNVWRGIKFDMEWRIWTKVMIDLYHSYFLKHTLKS